MEINSTTIPAWLVAAALIYTGHMWLITRKRTIGMDSRIFSAVLIIQGIIYGIAFQLFNLDVEVRGFYSRLMILVVCFSQAFPLTVAYIRSRRNEHRTYNG